MSDEPTAQMRSASYRLAALDQDFLLGESMRACDSCWSSPRPDEALRAGGRAFDAGGVRQRARARGRTRRARRTGTRRRGSSRASPRSAAARWTGTAPFATTSSPRAAAQESWKPPIAAPRTAGALTVGFNITLPMEQRPNPWSTPDLSFRFHYFAMRKMHLAMRANALVVFPGGFGTMDELFETADLAPDRQGAAHPHRSRRSRLLAIHHQLRAAGRVRDDQRADLDLFGFAEDAEGIWAELLRRGLKPHSSIELAGEQEKP